MNDKATTICVNDLWVRLFEQLPASTWDGRPADEGEANDWAHAVAMSLCERNGITPEEWDDYQTLAAGIEFH